MFKLIKDFLADDKAVLGHSADELQVAVAALMVEAALMDNEFDERERQVISSLLEGRFHLSGEECTELLETASKRVEESPQLFGFTSVVKDQFDPDERIELIEMMWEVVYADGRLGDYEANLMRRIAGLIFVSDRESGAARKRALARLGQEG